ncbi:MAG: DUF5320 domain-containing protein [Velocimicrobium sp.]
MPRGDGTGPIGMGAMTGRRAGLCNGVIHNHDLVRGFGRYGCQRGYKRQFVQTGIPGYLRLGYHQNIQDSEEKVYLEMQETRLENQLKSVKERLSNLNNADES